MLDKASFCGAIIHQYEEKAIILGGQIPSFGEHVVIFEGELESLRRFRDDVDNVRAGTECGIGVRSYNDVKPNDQIEVFERVEVERAL